MIIQAISYGAVETARLPKEYQEVEYIQSSGTQYIDTGVIPTVNTRVVLDIEVLSYSGSDYLAIFGERHTTQTTNLFSLWIKNATTFRTDFGSNAGNTEITANPIGRYVIDKNKNVTTVQGVTVTNPTSTIQTTYSIYLLSNNYGGTADERRPIAKVYSCQIYDSGILARDFVPCYRKADGVVGLYDLVNDTFYDNAGTGTFIKGADVGGSGSSGGPFAFTYSGDFTDSRVDGIGDVTLNTSGTLTVLSGKATVSVYILGAGGGGAYTSGWSARSASGGGGGYQTVEVELAPGTYDIVIGSGGAGRFLTNAAATANGGTGGDTTAFGYTSTGGTGGRARGESGATAGKGGTPNGNAGAVGNNTAGGSPNGGASNGTTATANSGGPGLVRITFS